MNVPEVEFREESMQHEQAKHRGSTRKEQERIVLIPPILGMGYWHKRDNKATSDKMNSKGLTNPPEFIDLNRSMAHFPLARDSRKRAVWEKNGDSYQTILPSERTIQLSVLDRNPRILTAFDTNLLCYLIASAKMYRGLNLSFRSYKHILGYIGYDYNQRTITEVKDSIDLLSRIRITYKIGSPGQFTLSPPVVKYLLPTTKAKDDILVIQMDEEFYKYATKKPFARIPLPLPKTFAAQNLLFLMCASTFYDAYDKESEFEYKRRPPVPINIVTRKVGLENKRKVSELFQASIRVGDLYKLKGGYIVIAIGNGLVCVDIYKNIEYKKPKEDEKEVPMETVTVRREPIKRVRLYDSENPKPMDKPKGYWKEEKYIDSNGRQGRFWIHTETGEESDSCPYTKRNE